MPKVNTFVLLQNAKEEIKRLQYEVANARLVSTLFCADAAVIAAHEVFQRLGDIIAEFQESYQTWCQRIAKKHTRPIRSMAVTSELMGLSKNALANYERGKRVPRADALRMIADYYGVSTDYILGRTDTK